jgi:hypothetical protein
VLGPFDARVPVVVAQVPLLVGANGQTATRADHLIATLEATCELHSPATMDRPHISRWRLFFASRFRRCAELSISLDFARLRLSPSITLYRSSIGEKRQKVWVSSRVACLKNASERTLLSSITVKTRMT